MFNPKKYIFVFSMFAALFAMAGNGYAIEAYSGSLDEDPSVIIHNATVPPGEFLLQIDALDFTGDNGQVAAITLRIEIDTSLLTFIGIENQTLDGSWLANYNPYENEISITYTAPFGTGYDIDGKLLDLHLIYYAGFTAELTFKSGCEVSNVNLQTIDGIVYENGFVNQTTPFGSIFQDSVVGVFNEPFSMPVMAEGNDFDSVSQVYLRLGYDVLQLEYDGYTESALSDMLVSDSNGIVTVDWEESGSMLDLTSLDTLLFFNFSFIGDSNTITPLLSGSKVFNNEVLVASDFNAGYVKAMLLVELINNPDTAGVATGGGYYFPGDSVSVTAEAAMGFNFINWTKDSVVVSADSAYTFVKAFSNDTLTANYQANIHSLTLTATPDEGGDVFGSGDYSFGETVTASATSTEDYYFSHWLDGQDTVSYDSSYVFSMPDNDVDLTAVFNLHIFNVTAEPNNSDYGTTEGGGVFGYGDTATLIATPFENFKFVGWTENNQVVAYDPVYSFPVYSDHELIGQFQYNSICSAPVGLFAGDFTETSAMLSWLPSGSEEEWDIIWGVQGFDTIDDGELVSGITENQYLLEELDPGSVYDFYVRAICSDDLTSFWAGPHTFSTWFVDIEKRHAGASVLIYPNPVKNELTVFFENGIPSRTKYRVVNVLGKVEQAGEIGGSEIDLIRLGDLTQGIYTLQLFYQSGSVTKLFLKE